ncbi:hypothetical protein Cs7R123_44720 [Catellatospora sp. TT07R-123]|uniref:hypothetical protein n=1 Tax=Catellatospora sp. TT07R-123 TaxID=2733863 RepID=UPI001AFD94D5|nr:hypothetical protein [Catellatospora sp. TT07R-123]GHJ47130.1 hypothetical protein Cs7R123_44720 [Catellatospora sp. TT07R-123]
MGELTEIYHRLIQLRAEVARATASGISGRKLAQLVGPATNAIIKLDTQRTIAGMARTDTVEGLLNAPSLADVAADSQMGLAITRIPLAGYSLASIDAAIAAVAGRLR